MKLRMLAVAAATTLIATLGLTACSQDSSADCLKTTAGKESNSVKAEGDFGGKVTVTVGSPLAATAMEHTVVTKGTGEVPKTGQSVDVRLSIYSGSDGQAIDAVQTTLTANDSTLAKPVRAGLDCMAVGTRSVTVFPGSDLYTADQLQQVGLNPTDNIILVTDVLSIQKDPEVTKWESGAPSVSFDSNKIPTIDLSSAQKPDGIAVKILKEGNGATIAPNDTVKVQYHGVLWSDGTVFDSNYGKDPSELQLTGVITGFRVALVGQKVGTQMLVSIPAKYAYGDGTASASNKLAGQDLLFLIDIVSVSAATSK